MNLIAGIDVANMTWPAAFAIAALALAPAYIMGKFVEPSMTDPVQALETSLLAFIEELTDAHEISVAAVVGTLHVVAYEVLRQNGDEGGESEPFDPGLN